MQAILTGIPLKFKKRGILSSTALTNKDKFSIYYFELCDFSIRIVTSYYNQLKYVERLGNCGFLRFENGKSSYYNKHYLLLLFRRN